MSFYLFGAIFLVATSNVFLGATGDSADTKTPLPASEWGYLSRGARRALHAAVFALCECGALRVNADGTVTRAEELSTNTPILERAIHDQVRNPIDIAALGQAPTVRQALRDMRSSLLARDLLVSTRRRNLACGALTLALVLAFAGILASLPESDWYQATLCLIYVISLLAWLVLLWRVEPATRAANILVKDLRQQCPKPACGDRQPIDATNTPNVDIKVALHGMRAVTGRGPRWDI